jgi:hypothetical protein
MIGPVLYVLSAVRRAGYPEAEAHAFKERNCPINARNGLKCRSFHMSGVRPYSKGRVKEN